MNAQRRLIVGSAGSANAFGTIRSVRDRFAGSVFVIAVDTNPQEMVAASTLADAFVRMPPASDPNFAAALRDCAARYSANSYLPIHDAEIDVATRLLVEGRFPPGLDLISPPRDVVRRCSDKWAMHQWLQAQDLPSPETRLATIGALETMQRPAVLKPREGSGGENFLRVHEARQLEGVDPAKWLLQEVLEKPEIAIDTFLSRDRKVLRCACREYLEMRATVATKARIFHDGELAGIAERLARALPLCGAFLVQVMQDSRGKWRITDVNPRVGSATRMCVPCGLDFAAANLADFWGEDVSEALRPLTGEYYVARQYEEYVTRRPQGNVRPV
jgi:carbamoyl-phosphate synthase large subunit